MSKRLNQEREQLLQPRRVKSCKATLEEMGFDVQVFGDDQDNRLEFKFNGSTIKLWPYSGWFTGKNIKDGRGFRHLLRQLKNE